MFKTYYLAIHEYQLIDHNELCIIGYFTTEERAKNAIKEVKDAPGFRDHPEAFRIKKVKRIRKYKLADKVFWKEGFETYTY